jgi:signal transduction histidine kinase
MLDRIVAAATRMDRWIDDLIDVTHLRAGQALALRLEPTDLVELARAAVTDHRAASARHTLRLQGPQRGPGDGLGSQAAPRLVALADSARLRRVLDNLLSNALKYSPEGGEITVSLTLAVEAGGAWAVLCVRDQGIGIPAADLPHVFAWARRATNVGPIAGQGLGLAGAQRIIEQHGGTLTVQSHEGQGSAFTIRLPLPPAGGAACAS